MSPENFQRLMAAFDEVAPLAPGDRATLLDVKFQGEPALRAEVEALLAEHDRVDSPVATAGGLEAIGRGQTPLTAPLGGADGSLPVLKGAYRLLRTLGEGGMGVVYEAEQSFPRRRVALKAIRGGFVTGSLLRRFRNEIELLARLHHPGIAQIYEAGFADESHQGQAFFVMELVDGQALTKYATSRDLDLRARVELLRKVCDAVQHAHQRGVIHRDLKPGNILVTAAGQPKILDFGVARAIDDAGEGTLATRAGQVIGTPSYMSPEQMSGEAVDTRSDVYSMGVIAYELLAGALPFDFTRTPFAEAAKALRERAPAPPSSRNRALRGDLDLIIASAMHPDRERRYPSAASLADDFGRYLAGHPITARRDSAVYVLGKLARRHWPIVALGVLLVASVIAFGIVSSVLATRSARLARESDADRRIADRQRLLAQEASAQLADELHHANIEQARLEGALGNLAVAEDALWREFLRDPEGLWPLWALRELYARSPVRWTVATASWPIRTALAPAVRRAVVLSRAGELIVHDLADGRELHRHTDLGANPQALGVSADGRTALVGFADGRLLSIDPESGTMRRVLEGPAHRGAVGLIVFSHSGNLVATSGADRVLRVWDARTFERVTEWPLGDTSVANAAFSPDERSLAAVSRDVRTMLRVWRLGENTPQHVIRDASPLGGWSIEPLDAEGRWLVGCGDRTVRIFDQTTGSLTTTGPDFRGYVRALSIHTDDGRVLVAGAESLWLWTPGSMEPPRVIGRERRNIAALCWADRHVAVILTDEGIMRAFDTREVPMLTRLGGFDSWCFSTTFSPDGTLLAIGGSTGTIEVFDTADVSRRWTLGQSQRSFRIRGLAFLADSHTLVTGGMDGAVRIFNAHAPEPRSVYPSRAGEIYGMAVDAQERYIATGHSSRVVRILDLRTGDLVRELPRFDRRIEGLAFSPDGTALASSGPMDCVILWDTATWEERLRLPTTSPPWGVAYSPDGTRLYVSTHAGAVEVFDLDERRRLGVLEGHARLIPALSVSSDGRMFASGGEDGLIRIWDAASLRRVMTLDPGGNEVVTVAFHPTARWLAASTAFQFTALYDLQAVDDCIAGNKAYHRSRFTNDAPKP